MAGAPPIGDTEIIQVLGDRDSLVVDLRDTNDRVKGPIPGSLDIAYTEVVERISELACVKTAKGMDCSKAKKVFAVCNGPTHPQSPIAIRAMPREGFPADKIYDYCGSMLDWDALGLTSIKNALSST